MPSRIPRQKRDKTANEKREESWGKCHWFEDGQERGLRAGIYLAPNLILEFADWTQFRMKGREGYRMTTDLENAVITERLVEYMGEAADIVGGLGPGVLIEGYSDMDFHTLLCNKYSSAFPGHVKITRQERQDLLWCSACLEYGCVFPL